MKKSIYALTVLMALVCATPSFSVDFGGGYKSFGLLKVSAHQAIIAVMGMNNYTDELKVKVEHIMNSFTHPLSAEELSLGVAVRAYNLNNKSTDLLKKWIADYATGSKTINYGSGLPLEISENPGMDFGGGYHDLYTIRIDANAYIGQLISQNQMRVIPRKQKTVSWINDHIDAKIAFGGTLTDEDRSLGIALRDYQQGKKDKLIAWCNKYIIVLK